MKFKKLFQGRVNRRDFFFGGFVFGLINTITAAPIYLLFFLQHPGVNLSSLSTTAYKQILSNSFSIFTIEGAIFFVLSTIILAWSMSLYVRRFHDVGKQGMLVVLVLSAHYLMSKISGNLSIFYLRNHTFPTFILSIYLVTTVSSLIEGVLYLYLLLKKGEQKTNKYGKVPADKFSLSKILLNE